MSAEPRSDENLDRWKDWMIKEYEGRMIAEGHSLGFGAMNITLSITEIIELAKVGSKFLRNKRKAMDRVIAEKFREMADSIDPQQPAAKEDPHD